MMRRSVALRVVLIFFAVSTFAIAQSTGSITGTVKDSSGAVISGAKVVVTNAAGFNRTTVTNADGNYLVAALPGGAYNVEISAKGFKTFDATNYALQVGQRARIDATLPLGSVATEVVVQGDNVAQVETQSSELSGTVTGKQITQLELNGRNYTQLVALTPGATNQSGVDEPGVGLATVAYSINGGRTEYNNWSVDGGNNLDDGSNTTMQVYPSIDSIAQFRVLTSNYGAQYGRNGSGTVEVETKSGTSSFHGDVYEFVRNDAFNARNFFSPTVPEYKKNDYGYTIGGPIFIPHVYNTNKDKTFFFFSQEWRKEVVPGTVFNVPVPSLAERGCTSATAGCGGGVGNFSELCPGTDCPIDPNTGSPFPGNQVPIDPRAVPLLAMFPLPNAGGPGAWFFNAAPAQPTNWREELVRVDHNINQNLRATVRFIHDSWNTVTSAPLWTNGGSFPTIFDNLNEPGVSLVTSLTAVASPTLLNEFVFDYSADHIAFQNNGAWQRPPGYNLGLFQNGFGGGKLPGVALSGGIFDGLAQDAGYVPNGPLNSNPQFEFRDNVSKILGRHNFQFGAYYVASQKNELPQFEPSVNGFFTFGQGSTTTGNAFADLLVGDIASFAQANGQPKYYLRYKIFEPYFQDDWRITDRLTLNLGLRISMFGTVYENLNQAFNFDPTKYVQGQTFINPDGSVGGNPFNGLVQCGKNGVPSSCMSGHLFNPAPRLGFAWDPSGNGKTAIRGGYGVFFEHTNGNEAVATQLEGSPPLVQTPNQSNIVGYGGVGGAVGESFPLTVVSIPNKAVWPYMQQWHLDIQHQFWKNVVGTISYVGSKGTHLGRRFDLNQLRPVAANLNPYVPGEPIGPNDCTTGVTPDGVPVPGFNPGGLPTPGTPGVNLFVACGNSADPFRPFLGFSTIRRLDNGASSIYHGLQLSARKTVGSLQLSVAYTYSHSIDDASSGGDGSFVDSYNFHLNRASSNFDQRHVATVSYIYDLPIFRTPGLTHTLLGGWQWSGITSIQTGAPFSVVNGGGGNVPGDNAGVGNGVGTGSRVDIVGDPNSGVPNLPSNQFGPLLFNPAVFVAPQGLTFGDSGRNILRNPRQTNFDMALFKHFPIHESVGLEFRAEAFNVFNHTEFGYIGGDAGSAAGNGNLNSFDNSAGCYGVGNSAGDPSCLAGSGFLRPATAHNPRILQLGLKLLF